MKKALIHLIGPIVCACWPVMCRGAMPPRLAINVASPFEVVSDLKADRCEPSDTVDAPPRAFRDANSQVHLIASHDIWREFTGTSLDTVKYNCRVRYSSAGSNDPAMLSDYQWLASPYTIDGQHIDAIVHNEYHPDLQSDLCPSHKYIICWLNTLTYIRSEDGGQTYRQPSPPTNFVAGLPYPYRPEIGFPIGYFQPSNIVELAGFYYVLFTTNAYLRQEAGTCIMRTNDLSNPATWRGWDGYGFSVQFMNAYGSVVRDPEVHLCKPLRARLGAMGGLARDPGSGAFVLVTQGGTLQPEGRAALGMVASASFDLISWSDPVQIWRDPSGATSSGDPRATDHDPSILDPTSPSRNFDVLAGKPYIYFIRKDATNRPYDRRLMRVQVRFAISSSPL